MTKLYINNTNLVDGANAKIAGLDDGSILIVWAQEQENKTSAIVAGRYYEYGGIEYNVTYISDNTLNVNCSNPLISTFPDNTYSIIWLSKNETNCEILTQSFYIDTTTLSDIQTLAYTSDNNCPTGFISDAVSDIDNNKAVFVAWSNSGNTTVNNFYINSTTALCSPIAECTFSLDADSINILAMDFDVAIILWTNSYQEGYLQRFNLTNCSGIQDPVIITEAMIDFVDGAKSTNSTFIVVAWVEASLPDYQQSLNVQRFYTNLTSIDNVTTIWSNHTNMTSGPLHSITVPPAIAIDDDDSFEITWSYLEETQNSTVSIIMVQSFASNGTALNQTEIGEDDSDMFPPEIVAFEDGAYGVMWSISSLQSSNVGYLQQSPDGEQLIVEVVPAPPISCPASISFGTSAQLSPNGVAVRNSDVSYFNGNGYVAIWSTVDDSNPKAITSAITAQLFDDNNGAVPSQSYTVLDTAQRIGKSTVAVFEDRSFLVAWSTQTRTGAKWKINVQYYRYLPATTTEAQTYTTENIDQIEIESSSHNNGRFSLTTLVLDNAFIIATMKDKYNIKIARYDFNVDPDTNDITSSQPYLDIIQPVKSSAAIEVIVKAVPTQDFFTVIWSRLSKESDGKGIFLQNYKTPTPITPAPTPVPTDTPTSAPTQAPILPPNPVFSSPLSIQSNPRSVQADLSYGGTITVVWHEASTDCDNQQVLSYQAQMFNVTGSISQIIQVANGQNVPNSTPTPAPTSTSAPDTQDLSLGPWSWLHQVISYEDSFVVTFIDKPTQAQQPQLMTAMIFNKDGTLATAANQQLGQATQAPNAPPPTMVPTPPPTPAPTPTNTPIPQSQLREFYELSNSGEGSESGSPLPSSGCVGRKEVSTKKISDSNVERLVKIILSVNTNHYNKPPWRMIYGRDISNTKLNDIQTIAQEFLSVLRKATTSINTQVIVNKIAARYGGIYKNFISNPDQINNVDDIKNIILPDTVGIRDLNSIACNFDCTADVSSIVRTNKEIFLCKDYSDNSKLLPSSNQVFNTQYGILANKVFNIVLKNDKSFSYLECVNKVKQGYRMITNPGCRAIFMEAAYTVSLCSELLPPYNINKVCNYTSTDESNTNQNIYSISNPITSTDTGLISVLQKVVRDYSTYDLLPDNLQTAFSTYIQNQEVASAWNIIYSVLDCMLKRLTVEQEDSVNFIYGHATSICGYDVEKIYGYVQNDLGYAVFLCKDFISLDALFPLSAPKPEVIANSKFHVLAHELSHTCGTTDLFGGNQIYDTQNCETWADEHPPIINNGETIIADCIAFFIDSAYLNQQ